MHTGRLLTKVYHNAEMWGNDGQKSASLQCEPPSPLRVDPLLYPAQHHFSIVRIGDIVLTFMNAVVRSKPTFAMKGLVYD